MVKLTRLRRKERSDVQTELLNRFETDKRELYSFLKNLGYEVYLVDWWSVKKINAIELPSGDWFCVPYESCSVVKKANKNLKKCGGLPLVRYLNPLVK